jgi:SNF2 family DNA or RNA helicase
VSSPYPNSKTIPWQHQIDGFNLSKNHDNFYYAWDMGAGKTKGAIDFANSRNAKKVLIVCPNKVIPVWPGQFKTHSYSDYNILPVLKKIGNSIKKARQIYDHLKMCESIGQNCAVVINYESCWREPIGPVFNDNRRITNLGVLLSQEWDLIIADEAHRMKTPGGRASWMMKRLQPKAKSKLWLSGTPMPHSPLDLYAQFRALDPTIFGTNFSFFKREYCVMGGFEGRQIIGWINQERLQKKFFTIAHHVNADDCLDLPDKQDIIIECDLDPKAKRIYGELNRNFISDVGDGIITASNALVKLLRLAQIAGGYLVYEKELASGDFWTETVQKERVIDNNKIETTIELIKDLPPEEPIVIFFRFTNEIQRMTDALKKETKRRITEVSGRVSESLDFKDGIWLAQTTNTALIQIQAGCEGIDLTAARYAFYFSMGLSLGQYRQSRKRIRRPGQTRKCFYYHIVARGTVDKKIMRSMEQKKQVVNYVLRKISGQKIVEAPNFLAQGA